MPVVNSRPPASPKERGVRGVPRASLFPDPAPKMILPLALENSLQPAGHVEELKGTTAPTGKSVDNVSPLMFLSLFSLPFIRQEVRRRPIPASKMLRMPYLSALSSFSLTFLR